MPGYVLVARRAIISCEQLTPENRQREVEGLLEALERYKPPRGTIITRDAELTEKHVKNVLTLCRRGNGF
jgi:hypothetical protein